MAQQILLAPPSERTLSQAEGLAVVQIFLNASLACIAHARELIPWTSPCFRTGYVDQITLEDDPPGGESLYSAFQGLTSEKTVGEGQEIKLLEQGVFDALHRSYLDSLRVFVTKATESQPVIVETYHFAFAYDHGRVTGVRLSPLDQAFVLENVHKSFKAAIRALLRSLRNLPRLPARRKLGMSLTYNETCPMVYQPPGFVDKDEYQEEEGGAMCEALLRRDEDVVGALECGHHQLKERSNGFIDRVASTVSVEVSMDQVQCKCYGRDKSLTSATISEHFCYTCLLSSERPDPSKSPLLITLLRMAVGYLTTKAMPGSRIEGNFLQTRLQPPRWTTKVLDRTLERLVEEGLLVRRAGGSFEVTSLSDSELRQVQERCMSPLASIEDLYEICADIEKARNGKDLMIWLKAYARGNDYTTAEGCEKLTAYDDFGDPVVRWGYRLDATIPSPRDSVVEGGTATPVRRRKISISRILIDIDGSPSAASMSLEETTGRNSNDRGYNTDCSTTTWTGTAD
ncbi:hypothetical protein AYO22_07475 [Fonsecaea multimorphosa]|nr:hypothetical protein AYO22_07475 [Fonsecaea multimorphosa]